MYQMFIHFLCIYSPIEKSNPSRHWHHLKKKNKLNTINSAPLMDNHSEMNFVLSNAHKHKLRRCLVDHRMREVGDPDGDR